MKSPFTKMFQAAVSNLSARHPEWWAAYEDSNLDRALEDEGAQRLLETAPTHFAAGLVAGRMLARPQLP